jgi:hypothetical protein
MLLLFSDILDDISDVLFPLPNNNIPVNLPPTEPDGLLPTPPIRNNLLQRVLQPALQNQPRNPAANKPSSLYSLPGSFHSVVDCLCGILEHLWKFQSIGYV